MYESLDNQLDEQLSIFKVDEAWLHVHRGRRVWSAQLFCPFGGSILAYACIEQ